MPRAATALANSTVYYKGNKEPWDWLVRQFIYISCSIFIYFPTTSGAAAPPASRARCRSQRRTVLPAKAMIRALQGRQDAGGAGAVGGSQAEALGALVERQRVGNVGAGVVSAL